MGLLGSNPTGSISMWSKFRYGLGLLGVLFIFGNLLISVANSLGYGISTGDWHPLVENSMGRLVSADTTIKEAVTELLNPNISHIYNSFLKQQILQSLIFMFIYGYCLFWIINKAIGAGNPDHERGWGSLVAIILITIVLFMSSELFYNQIYMDRPLSESYPFVGVVEMIKHRDVMVNFGDATGGLFSIGIPQTSTNISNATLETIVPKGNVGMLALQT